MSTVQQLGKHPSDIHNIIVTHCHPDHAGSLAALKQLTHASVWMHPHDAAVVRGRAKMVMSTPSPGLGNAILYRIFIKNVPPYIPATEVGNEIQDGDVLPIADGIQAIHTPGHSAGHVALLVPGHGGLLFVGDACSDIFGLSYSIVYDDFEEDRRSLPKLAQLDFKTVCFGHGKIQKSGSAKKFKKRRARLKI